MNEENLFHEALAKSDDEERTAFLDAACVGQPVLRAEVDALLAASQRLGSFLNQPAIPRSVANATMAQVADRTGSLIGPYKLLQQIGEGGFGVVYRAEQEMPVHRIVALKIIKPGMDTAQVIARFESERQALAIMDHPNIAKVYDAGATDSGLPYFVMELVNGVPITEFCDIKQATLEARLKLFVDVCHAIQHAHQKGIIHRDIKPSNVMVSLHDGLPVVKVIDFGVAKATSQDLTARTVFTELGQIVGTPVYMSPEQAGMSSLGIDTRSDIYSLGVLLYELLTGTTPLESKRLREAGYVEMQRMICEEESQRPSTRLSSLGDSASIQAGNRGLEVRRLVQLLGGDLDWVVMKALDKDRNRRYETASELALDLLRHLRDEPVLACPPSSIYQMRKFMRRNKGPMLGASLLLLAILAGLIGTTLGWIESRRQRDASAVSALSEKRAKESALAREAESKAILEFVEQKVFAAARPQGQDGGLGRDVTMRQAMESAQSQLESSLPDQPIIEAKLRNTIGSSFWFLGDAKSAESQFVRAIEIFTAKCGSEHPDTLASMNGLALSLVDLGRHAEARKLNEQTLEIRKAKLGPNHPFTLTSMNNLASNYASLGLRSEALKLREQTLELQKVALGHDHIDTLRSMGNLANSYALMGRDDETMKLNEQTLLLRQSSLGMDHPDTLLSMSNLAISYANVDRQKEALELREKVLELRKAKLGDVHPQTLVAMHNVSSSYATLGRHSDALKLREETLELRKNQLGTDHPHTLFSILTVATSLVELDRGTEALPMIDDCLERATGKVVDPRLVPKLIDLKLRIFQQNRDVISCLETAKQWEAFGLSDAPGLFQAARHRAACAAVVKEAGESDFDATRLSVEQSDLAMAWLNKAVAAGYKDFEKLQTDKDLDVLRDRDDFKNLMGMLETPKSAVPSR